MPKSFLSDLGYETGVVTYKFVAGKPADSVLEQAPKAKNKTPKGSKVDLVVCRDPKDLSMPDVMGSSLNDAKKALTELGIMDITVRYVESGSSEGSIVGMEPPAALSLPPTVKLYCRYHLAVIRKASINMPNSSCPRQRYPGCADHPDRCQRTANCLSGRAESRRTYTPKSGSYRQRQSAVLL